MPLPLKAFALTAFLAFSAWADNAFTFGGGLNSSFSDVEEGDGVESRNRLGFNIGIGFEAQVAPSIWIVPELNLETRGQHAEGDDPFFGHAESRLDFTYLEIPVFFMLKIPAGKVTWNLFAGPELGILTAARAELELNGEEVLSEDVTNQVKDIDFGIEMGAGVEFPMGRGAFFIRPSYYVGFLDVADQDDDEDDDEPDDSEALHLRNLKLKFGFRIPL